MRNDTKLKKLLREHEMNISMSENKIVLLLINNVTETSCYISGKNITEVLNECLKIVKNKALYSGTEQ